jgi:small-conductance mechanosensitive channel
MNTPAPTITRTATSTPVTPTNTPIPSEVEESPALIITPTIAPTATPGVLMDIVEQLAEATGADQVSFLGLTGEDWMNLLVSVFIFLLAWLFVSHLVYLILRLVVSRTPYKYDNILLDKVRPQIRMLLAVAGLQFGTIRLLFLDPALKQWLNQIYISLYVVVFTIIIWKVFDIALIWYQEEVEPKHPDHQYDAILTLLSRIGRFFLVSVGVIMILSINNIDVSVLIAALGIGGLALSLAAQDSLANLISGVLILLDQPFRVGDRIEIQGLGTWGDVVDIGLRSTRIRTRDNILVIVPNSKIGTDQVINYSYPDPQYRIQMEINIPYGEEVEKVRQIIVDTVCEVAGIVADKPVEALYVEMGGTGMVFRVRWWIESYIDTRRMFDHVNTALQAAFDEVGIVIPAPAYDIFIKGDSADQGAGGGES